MNRGTHSPIPRAKRVPRRSATVRTELLLVVLALLLPQIYSGGCEPVASHASSFSHASAPEEPQTDKLAAPLRESASRSASRSAGGRVRVTLTGANGARDRALSPANGPHCSRNCTEEHPGRNGFGAPLLC